MSKRHFHGSGSVFMKSCRSPLSAVYRQTCSTARAPVASTCTASRLCGTTCRDGELCFSSTTGTAQGPSAAPSSTKVSPSPVKDALRLVFEPWLIFFLHSFGADGLQPQPPVLWDGGAALHHTGRAARHPAGPLHPGVHAAAEHDAAVQRERHEHDGERPPQLRGLPVWSHDEAHVSRGGGATSIHVRYRLPKVPAALILCTPHSLSIDTWVLPQTGFCSCQSLSGDDDAKQV